MGLRRFGQDSRFGQDLDWDYIRANEGRFRRPMLKPTDPGFYKLRAKAISAHKRSGHKSPELMEAIVEMGGDMFGLRRGVTGHGADSAPIIVTSIP